MKKFICLLLLLVVFNCKAQDVKDQESKVPEKISVVISSMKNESFEKIEGMLKEKLYSNFKMDVGIFEVIKNEIQVNKNDINGLKIKASNNQTVNDIQAETIGNLITKIEYLRVSDSIKIAVLERRINTLQTFIKDSIAFVHTTVTPPVVPIVGEVAFIGDAWTDNNDGSYHFDASENYSYLHFYLNEDLLVGNNYEIEFDVQNDSEDKRALFNVWTYTEEGVDFNGSLTSNTSYDDGHYKVILGTHTYKRVKIGFRSANFAGGGPFTISNVSIVKQ